MIAEKIHINEIIGCRFDNSYVLYQHKMSNYKYPVVPLYKFLEVKPQYGAGEAGVPRNDITSPRYIRITDIDENGFLSRDLGVTAKTVEEKYILNNNDILIARSGNTVGKSYIHKTSIVQDTCFYAGYLIRFVVDAEKILPDYVYILTKLSPYTNWIKVTQRVTGQPNINAEEYSNLPIPFPPLEIQQKVVDIYKQAQTERNNKYQTAKQQLDSIDDYLLEKLDILLKFDGFNSNCYPINLSKLIGERMDVGYHNQSKHGLVTEMLKNSKYPTASLASLAKDIFQGVGKNETDDRTYVLLKVKNILQGNKIDYSDVEFVKSVPQNKLLLRNDIISPFIGEAVRQIKFSIFNNEEHKYTVDNNTGVIRIKEGFNAQYVCEYLCSCLGEMQIERLIGGGGVPFLGASGAKKIIIVVPPIEIQNEIGKNIAYIRNKADDLYKEGDALLENAKQKIEKLIFE